MSSYTIYALKGPSELDGVKPQQIYQSLMEGVGRFGWSEHPDGDLQKLKEKWKQSGWDSLTTDEKESYQEFLLDLQVNDFVVYINVPKWGKCTSARVSKAYFWDYSDVDFNHRFGVDRASVAVFDRNDAIVHPALSARLKLRGRWWRIYLTQEFEGLSQSIQRGDGGKLRTPASNLAFLREGLAPIFSNLAELIHHTHPNTDLEVLIAETFRRIPGVKEVIHQGGAGDHGADIRVIFEAGLPILGLKEQKTCVVQVKSFEDEHWDTQAIADIKRAFEQYPDSEFGLIVSTAAKSAKEFDDELDMLRETLNKPVALLLGADVATFLLQFRNDLYDQEVLR